MSEKNSFLGSILEGRNLSVGKMETSKYYPDRMTREEGDVLSWDKFKEKIKPLRGLQDPETGLEFIVTSKSPSWTYRDINMFVGSEDRDVETIDDLSDEEGETFFKINTKVAQEVLDDENREVNVSIGYNPEDNLPGQHSIRTKLHSHIYVSRDKEMADNREPMSWKDLDWFKRLSVIEPFAPVYRDFIKNLLEQKGLLKDFLASQDVDTNTGYISMQLNNQEDIYKIFPEIKFLYQAMQDEYTKAEALFTDRQLDSSTNRYVPREENERLSLVKEYIDNNKDWLSPESIKLLEHLAKNIKYAKGNSFRNMSSAEEAWLTKGFAGMINLSFSHNSDNVRLDILPRVMTTSSASKILAGQGQPIVLERGTKDASEHERKIAEEYQEQVIKVIDSNFPSFIKN